MIVLWQLKLKSFKKKRVVSLSQKFFNLMTKLKYWVGQDAGTENLNKLFLANAIFANV